MNETEQFQTQSPAQREGVMAELACMACFAYLFGIVGATVQSLQLWWAEMLVYTLIPLALTFTLLHASHIHREMAALKRTAYLLAVAGAMLAGAVFFLGTIVVCGSIFAGLTRGHF